MILARIASTAPEAVQEAAHIAVAVQRGGYDAHAHCQGGEIVVTVPDRPNGGK